MTDSFHCGLFLHSKSRKKLQQMNQNKALRFMTKLRLITIAVIQAFCITTGLFGATDISEAEGHTLEIALKKAGSNRSEFDMALATAKPAQINGLKFLIAHMPFKDLESLDRAFLLENLDYAYRARADHAWASAVPEDVFLNDVLPYASLDVRRDRWRKDFYNRFSPMVANTDSLREAAIIINKAIRDELQVDYSTKRKKANQSPYESIDSGIASCTGLSILLCNALRAVGIPARITGIPMWTTKSGNHNWVEFYDPQTEKWHFTEYYPDKDGIDHGWLLADAAKANPDSYYHTIYASSWKSTGTHFPLVWNMSSKQIPAVNVTKRYLEIAKDRGLDKTDHLEIRIECLNAKGQRYPTKVSLRQLDNVVYTGTTPSTTDDLNNYLTFYIDPTQSYQLSYTLASGEHQTLELHAGTIKSTKTLTLRLP
jgi:hypothetical protein